VNFELLAVGLFVMKVGDSKGSCNSLAWSGQELLQYLKIQNNTGSAKIK